MANSLERLIIEHDKFSYPFKGLTQFQPVDLTAAAIREATVVIARRDISFMGVEGEFSLSAHGAQDIEEEYRHPITTPIGPARKIRRNGKVITLPVVFDLFLTPLNRKEFFSFYGQIFVVRIGEQVFNTELDLEMAAIKETLSNGPTASVSAMSYYMSNESGITQRILLPYNPHRIGNNLGITFIEKRNWQIKP